MAYFDFDYVKRDIANARELANNKNFRWSVRDIELRHDTIGRERPTITANLDILGTPNSTASMTELAVDLQNRLSGSTPSSTPEISNVIFNPPATIVFWSDKTKTVVKCQEGDEFDPEKGLAMAIVKKMNGNTGKYCDIFKKWVPEVELESSPLTKALDNLKQAIYKSCGSPTLGIHENNDKKGE